MPQNQLQFRASEETIKMAIALETLLEQSARKVQTTNHMQAKQAMQDYVVPALTLQKQWTHLLVGDVLHFVAAVVTGSAAAEAEVIVGIPSGDLDAIADELDDIKSNVTSLARLVNAAASGSKKAPEEAKKLAAALSGQIDELGAVLEEFRLESDDEEGYEPLFDDDEDDGGEEGDDEDREDVEVAEDITNDSNVVDSGEPDVQ